MGLLQDWLGGKVFRQRLPTPHLRSSWDWQRSMYPDNVCPPTTKHARNEQLVWPGTGAANAGVNFSMPPDDTLVIRIRQKMPPGGF